MRDRVFFILSKGEEKMLAIGKDYIDTVTGKVVHCQDTNTLNQTAYVGICDENGIVWDAYWVSVDKLVEKVENNA